MTNAGTITLTNPAGTNDVVYANSGGGNEGGTLSNAGIIVQQGAGNLQLNDGVQVSNAGLYQFKADSNILSVGLGNIGSVVNTATGTIEKTTTTGTSSIAVPFANQGGTLDAESGTLSTTDGGHSTGGTYNANGSGIVDVTGGSNPTFTGNYTGSGTGRVQLASGTLTIGSSSATFNFPNGLFVWSGGTVAGPGTLTNASTGFMTISGGTLNGTLNNQGTITQTGGTLTLNGSLGNVGIYNLAPTTTGTAITGGGTFTNTSTGLLELSTNVTATLLSPFANQSGTVATTAAVNAGKLVLGGSGSSTGGTYNATTAGAFIDLAGGSTSEFTGTYSGSGSGAVGLSQPGGVIGAGSIASSGASAILDFTAESFQVTTSDGINFDLNGNTLINAGTITLTSSSNVVVYSNLNGGNRGGTFSNTGTIVQQGSGNLQLNDGVEISNVGVYQFSADSGIVYTGQGNIGSFVNTATGAIAKAFSTGTSSIAVPFANQGGTVETESGTVTLSGGGTSTGGTYIANVHSVIDLTGGSNQTFTGTYTGAGTGTGTGLVQLASGTLTIGMPGPPSTSAMCSCGRVAQWRDRAR